MSEPYVVCQSERYKLMKDGSCDVIYIEDSATGYTTLSIQGKEAVELEEYLVGAREAGSVIFASVCSEFFCAGSSVVNNGEMGFIDGNLKFCKSPITNNGE